MRVYQEHKTSCLDRQCSLSNVTRTRLSHTELDFVRQKGGSICRAQRGNDVCVSYKPRYLLPATQNFDPLGGRFPTGCLAGLLGWLQFLPTFTTGSCLALVTLRTSVVVSADTSMCELREGGKQTSCDPREFGISQLVRCVAELVIVSIAIEFRIGDHHGGIALAPKRTVIAP
jgi:hypothetical protein